MGADLVVLAARHLRQMLERAQGPKVLLLDQETTGVVSCALSQSEILQKEVFLVATLDSLPQASLEHLSAVCFLRPTNENVLLLLKMLQQQRESGGADCEEDGRASGDSQGAREDSALQPTGRRRFRELRLFFTGRLPHQSQTLTRLARQDEADLIAEVCELYVDFFPLSPKLFSLGVDAVSQLQTQPVSLWSAYDEAIFQRMVDGLFSSVALLGIAPLIRYQKSSFVCRRLAGALKHRLEETRVCVSTSQTSASTLAEPPCGKLLVFIIDRREDPVTPLLNQWTYTAMAHELIGIKNNRLDLRKMPGVSEELKEVVLNPSQDKFYRDNCFASFGDLGVNVKQHLLEFNEQTKSTSRLDSLESMQAFLEKFPQYRKMAGSVSKHVTLIHELSRLVRERALLEVSAVEQDIATRENKTEHLRQVLQLIRSEDATALDKLRLALLFALRYEGDEGVLLLKEELSRLGVASEEVALIDAVTRYSSAASRTGDLFHNRNFLAVARSSISKGLQGTSNVYTQHKSLLYSVLENLIKEPWHRASPSGKTRETAFPLLVSTEAAPAPAPPREKLQTVLVFVVGGATYEEERDLEELSNATGVSLVLGGTSVVNSKAFLADVAQLVRVDALPAPATFGLPRSWT